MSTEVNCGNCKFFAQGSTCSFCANTKQTDTGYKKYVYWIFHCELFEQGIHKSRIEYMKTLNQIG